MFVHYHVIQINSPILSFGIEPVFLDPNMKLLDAVMLTICVAVSQAWIISFGHALWKNLTPLSSFHVRVTWYHTPSDNSHQLETWPVLYLCSERCTQIIALPEQSNTMRDFNLSTARDVEMSGTSRRFGSKFQPEGNSKPIRTLL